MSRMTARGTKRLRRVAAVLVGAAMIATAAGCSSGGGDATGGSTGDSTGSGSGSEKLVTIVAEGTHTYTRNFNPFQPTARWASMHAIYEPMMGYNDVKGQLDPLIATDYAWNDDATELTFTMRPDVKWSDGEPLTAKDVEYTFNLMKDNPALIGKATGAFDSYLGSVSSTDTDVTFTFKRPYTPGVFEIAQQLIVPEHIWKDVDNPVEFLNENPVGSGAFTEITGFSAQQYQVTKNPNYYQDVELGGLNLPAFSGQDQISAAVLSGEIEWGGMVSDPDNTYVAKDPEHNHYWWPRSCDVILVLNTTKAGFDDVVLRKAISMSVDRDRMIQTAVWGKSDPANATALAGDAFAKWIDDGVVSDGAEWVTRDVDKANAMLDEAGYAKGSDGMRTNKDGSPMKFSIQVPTGWSDWISSAQIVSDGAKEIGVDIELQTVAYEAYTNATNTGEFDATLSATKRAATPYDVYYNLMATATVSPVGTASTVNLQRYGNTDADALLEKFAATTDETEQLDYAKQLEQVFSDNAPVVPLYEQPDWGLYNTTHWTGFPNEDDPYAPLSLLNETSQFLVYPHIKPVS